MPLGDLLLREFSIGFHFAAMIAAVDGTARREHWNEMRRLVLERIADNEAATA